MQYYLHVKSVALLKIKIKIILRHVKENFGSFDKYNCEEVWSVYLDDFLEVFYTRVTT